MQLQMDQVAILFSLWYGIWVMRNNVRQGKPMLPSETVRQRAEPLYTLQLMAHEDGDRQNLARLQPAQVNSTKGYIQ